MVDFTYREMFPLKDDPTEYRLLTADHITKVEVDGTRLLRVASEGLTLLAEQAFSDVSHFLRASHLKQLAAIFDAAEGEFPMCQDTGTAIVIGKKGQSVWTGYSDEEALSKGIFNTYTQGNLRYSQNAALTTYEEKNTGCNLPAQFELYAVQGDEYHFLFLAKGGGSANKTYLYQETKAVLTPQRLLDFMKDKMKSLGTAACPPYHLAFVIGGTSAELNLKTVKLATARYLDGLPTKGGESGYAFRDLELEEQVLKMSEELGVGAQFGGKYFCLDARVIRLPRHGASCPIGVGVSCSADRNIKAKKKIRSNIYLRPMSRTRMRCVLI
jgi:fumarate hydratase class I